MLIDAGTVETDILSRVRAPNDLALGANMTRECVNLLTYFIICPLSRGDVDSAGLLPLQKFIVSIFRMVIPNPMSKMQV